MYDNCEGVTREKLDNVSEVGSVGGRRLGVATGARRPDMGPKMGDISPDLPTVGAGTGAEPLASSLIETSSVSIFFSPFSSC